jgi:hypothetical protein
MLASWWTVLIVGLIFAYLLLRFNSLWIYGFDRALRNRRHALAPAYESPHYYRLKGSGSLNTEERWPGWDGWYFFVIPQGKYAGTRMLRASVMTGLYGLDGVDNYSLVPPGVSIRKAVEYLMLVSTEEATLPGPRHPSAEGAPKPNVLAHSYVSKTELKMKIRDLDVAIEGEAPSRYGGQPFSGHVSGKWPEYSLHFVGTQLGAVVDVRFQANDLVWWADLPGIFTYFSAFGEFRGTISFRDPDGAEKPGKLFPLNGKGAFEHGFARKPWNFDQLYKPIRAVQRIFTGYRPIRYHYESFVSSDGFHGGWMYARVFGIDFRNRGGIYWDEQYIPILGVEIEYADPEPSQLPRPLEDRAGVPFYRRWMVRARTRNGVLEYTARRESPPPPVATNMTYYHLTLDGFYRGRKIRGAGYGEYLNI